MRCSSLFNQSRFVWTATLMVCALSLGCGENVKLRNPFVKNTKQQTQKVKVATPNPKTQTRTKTNNAEEEALKLMYRTASMRSGSSTFGSSGTKTSSAPRIGVSEAMTRLSGEIENSVSFAPTLVVWLVDSSDSAASLKMDFIKAASDMYQKLGESGFKSGKKPEDVLTTAIVSFGSQTNFITAAPTPSIATVQEKLKEISNDNSGKELTFAAVQEVLDKYGDYRTQQNKELMLVIISDEAGDDQHKLDAVISQAKTIGVRIHAVGTPAPFGRTQIKSVGSESRADGLPAIVRGPETRYQQRIDLQFGSSRFSNEEIDSGFGPFSLNYLCRSTGGAYLMARASGVSTWPGSALRFNEAKMMNYPPQYLTEEEYQAKLDDNAALAALHQVSKRPQIEGLSYVATTFTVRDEAQLKNDLDGAQRVAARLGPPTDDVYQILDNGEKDRDKITDKRWQASFDLALGRAAAAKARVDGYNQMLAILKGGRKFQDPNNDTWYLKPSDTLKEAGSRLEKVRAKAQLYLERVIKEHPDTPWAYLAEKELETPIGWEWTE